MRKRIEILDGLRGAAVIAMIIHHTMVLLTEFFGIYIDFVHTTLFAFLQFFFVSIFLLVSGICSNFSRNIAKRGGIVFAAALIVTLATAVILPLFQITGLEIYFGILHMFGLSMLLYALCKPFFDKIPTVVGITVSAALFIIYYVAMLHAPYVDSPFHILAMFGFPGRTFYSADYYPLFPYFFAYVCGAMIGRPIKNGNFPGWFYTVKLPVFGWIGKNSLWIYLVHQPIILGVLLLVDFLVGGIA